MYTVRVSLAVDCNSTYLPTVNVGWWVPTEISKIFIQIRYKGQIHVRLFYWDSVWQTSKNQCRVVKGKKLEAQFPNLLLSKNLKSVAFKWVLNVKDFDSSGMWTYASITRLLLPLIGFFFSFFWGCLYFVSALQQKITFTVLSYASQTLSLRKIFRLFLGK